MVYYPAYMKRKRRLKTDEQIKGADNIRQKLIRLANSPGYKVVKFIDSKGQIKARIGRVDGCGLGFVISPELAESLST